MMRVIVSCGLAAWLWIAAVPAVAEQRVMIGGREGLLNVPTGARVGAVLVSGSGGMSPNDLLMRSRHLFENQGVATLMISFDASPLLAVEALRRHVPRVGIVGMSAGTLSAARAVANGARPNSLVLISGFLMPGPARTSVRETVANPGALPPTLVIHNRAEACERTPAGAVEPFVAWSAGRARAIWIASGTAGQNPCGPLHYHGYPGEEASVVQAAAAFLARH